MNFEETYAAATKLLGKKIDKDKNVDNLTDSEKVDILNSVIGMLIDTLGDYMTLANELNTKLNTTKEALNDMRTLLDSYELYKGRR